MRESNKSRLWWKCRVHVWQILGFPSRIAGLLQTQNAVANAGRVTVDREALRIATSGEFANVEDMAKLVISNPGAEQRIYLRDVATIYRETKDIPDHVVRYNGKASLWLALSFADNVNVVEVGERLQNEWMSWSMLSL